MYINKKIYFQQNTLEWISIPVMPNLIPYIIMINVANVLIKAVVVLVKFCFHPKDQTQN